MNLLDQFIEFNNEVDDAILVSFNPNVNEDGNIEAVTEILDNNNCVWSGRQVHHSVGLLVKSYFDFALVSRETHLMLQLVADVTHYTISGDFAIELMQEGDKVTGADLELLLYFLAYTFARYNTKCSAKKSAIFRHHPVYKKFKHETKLLTETLSGIYP